MPQKKLTNQTCSFKNLNSSTNSWEWNNGQYKKISLGKYNKIKKKKKEL